MRSKVLVFLLCWFIQNSLFAQSYHSEFEAQSLKSLVNEDETSLINALLSLDKSMNAKKAEEIRISIDEFYESLDPKVLKTKSIKQISKKVFTSLHDQFLKRYELVASFDQIFSDGIYNCVSATAFYYIIFKRLDVPLELIAEPGHVYMTIGEGKEKLVIESTDPVNGYKSTESSSRVKTDYVESLIQAKVIVKEDYPGRNSLEIYALLFDVKFIIEPKSLVFYQYMNEGIVFLTKQKFDASINALRKSMRIDSTDQVKMLLQYVYAKALDEYNEDRDNPGKMISYVDDYISISDSVTDFLEKAAKDEICRLLYVYLIKKSEPDSAAFFYRKIMSGKLKDYPNPVREIRVCYNHELARYYMILKDIRKAFLPLVEAYSAEPTNVLYSSSVYDIMNELIYEEEVSIEQIGKEIDSTCNNCGCCEKTEKYLKYHHLILSISVLADEDKIDEAIKKLEESETLLKDLNFEKVDASIFAEAYHSIWSYYTQLKQYDKGEKFIRRGLEIDPDNKDLLHYLEVLEDFKK